MLSVVLSDLVMASKGIILMALALVVLLCQFFGLVLEEGLYRHYDAVVRQAPRKEVFEHLFVFVPFKCSIPLQNSMF